MSIFAVEYASEEKVKGIKVNARVGLFTPDWRALLTTTTENEVHCSFGKKIL